MEVIENVQGIIVTFWATHVGHNLLSKNDGSRVRGLLSSGMSWDQVLDEVQRECVDAKRYSRRLPPKKKIVNKFIPVNRSLWTLQIRRNMF